MTTRLTSADEDTIISCIRDIQRAAHASQNVEVAQFGHSLADVLGQVLIHLTTGQAPRLADAVLHFSMCQLAGGVH